MTAKYEALARRLLRAELAARGARDLDAAEAALASRLRFNPETLEYEAIGAFSDKPGHPNMDLSEFLAVTMKAEPALFGGQTDVPGRVGQPPANPFRSDATAHGPNLTEIMIAYRRDPEEAEQMARDAAFWSNIR